MAITLKGKVFLFFKIKSESELKAESFVKKISFKNL